MFIIAKNLSTSTYFCIVSLLLHKSHQARPAPPFLRPTTSRSATQCTARCSSRRPQWRITREGAGKSSEYCYIVMLQLIGYMCAFKKRGVRQIVLCRICFEINYTHSIISNAKLIILCLYQQYYHRCLSYIYHNYHHHLRSSATPTSLSRCQ